MNARIACASFLAAAALAIPAAHAQDALHEQRLIEAKAIVKSMELEKQMEPLLQAMSQDLAQVIVQAGGSAGRNPRVGQIVVAESIAMSRENAFRPGGLMDKMTQLYAETLSLEDLRDIRAFYQSPAARHLLDATPEMMQKMIQQSVAVSRTTLPGLCARVKLRLQEQKLAEAQTFTCPVVSS